MQTEIPNKSALSARLCPCGKAKWTELERIPRGLAVKLFLFWLPIKRYHCVKCRKKRLIRS